MFKFGVTMLKSENALPQDCLLAMYRHSLMHRMGIYASAGGPASSAGASGAGQPTVLHAPNLIFHSCLYVAHHSSSHLVSVSPQTMILKRSYSSLVHPGTTSLSRMARSPLVTGARLLIFSLAEQRAGLRATSRKNIARIILDLYASIDFNRIGEGPQRTQVVLS